jgi:hypothetical protein
MAPTVLLLVIVMVHTVEMFFETAEAKTGGTQNREEEQDTIYRENEERAGKGKIWAGSLVLRI